MKIDTKPRCEVIMREVADGRATQMLAVGVTAPPSAVLVSSRK
ncbi:hypothetical protein [Amycolatopsis alkalitolerans]|nr:hypothetical protein [Amycolatopsis alkalitolerans]